VANILNVTESDVIQSLESGDLRGRKIGSTWRITRSAMDEFLKN
jgi:excisionase family DNA binding protein